MISTKRLWASLKQILNQLATDMIFSYELCHLLLSTKGLLIYTWNIEPKYQSKCMKTVWKDNILWVLLSPLSP